MQTLKTLAIELTNFCNYKCEFCWARSSGRPRGYMSKNLFDKIMNEVRQMKDLQNLCLNFSGESTLHPDFDYFCKAVGNLKCTKSIITNGSMLGMVASYLINNNINVIVSVNGSGKGYEDFCGHSYSDVQDNIEYFMHLRGPTKKPTLTVYRHFWKTTDLNMQKFINEWRGKVDEIVYGPGIEDMEWKYTNKNIRYKECCGPCGYPFRYMAVLWDGKVVPCCRDIGCEMAFGDVNIQRLQETFDGPVYTELRNDILTNKFKPGTLCSRCKLWQKIPVEVKVV